MPDTNIKVKLPQLPPLIGEAEQDDQLYIWDKSAGKLCKADISQLPFGTGGGNGGLPILPATFTVTTTSPSYSTAGGASIVSDTRLIDATGYTVRTTQLNNAAFRASEIAYDAVNGKFTIPNFVLLPNEMFIIDAPGKASNGSSAGGSYDDLIKRITLLEQIAAPMMPSVFGARGGMLLWRKPANEIPAGWQEVIDYRGRTVIGNDPNDLDFSGVGTKTGGSKDKFIELKHIPNGLNIWVNKTKGKDPYIAPPWLIPNGRGATTSDPNHPANPNTTDVLTTLPFGSGLNYNASLPVQQYPLNTPRIYPEKFQTLDPYRIVMFIEFVGIGNVTTPIVPPAPLVLGSVVKDGVDITINWAYTVPVILQYSYDQIAWVNRGGTRTSSPLLQYSTSFTNFVTVYFRLINPANNQTSNVISIAN